MTKADQKTERRYYIDWLRILLIISVFLFHNGMVFNTWTWHIKNDRQFDGLLQDVMTFLHLWRMPLLFMISGAGTYFALGTRTPGQYLFERFKRLFIPLVAGIFILVPIQVYIEKIPQYDSLPDFYLHLFHGIYPEGNFSWHHLWFIAYLFVIALFITPFLNFLRSKTFKAFTLRIEKVVIKPLALNIFIIPLILSQALLRPYFEVGTNDLLNDWASFTYYILFFLSGFILIPVSGIAEAMRKYRWWYMAEVIAANIIMSGIPGLFKSEVSGGILYEAFSIIMVWSCAIAAIGFAKQHLNVNPPLRKLANEAIYPFYLLHQPVIVVLGFYIIPLDISVLWKAAALLFLSFSMTIAIYWIIVRPTNILSFIFGMKKVNRIKDPEITCALKPEYKNVDRHLPGLNQKIKRSGS